MASMATSASTILDAIDDAIASFVNDGSVRAIELPGGGSISYSSLTELVEARKHYEKVASTTSVNGGSAPLIQFGVRPRRPGASS
jgi:hypothetical protein